MTETPVEIETETGQGATVNVRREAPAPLPPPGPAATHPVAFGVLAAGLVCLAAGIARRHPDLHAPTGPYDSMGPEAVGGAPPRLPMVRQPLLFGALAIVGGAVAMASMPRARPPAHRPRRRFRNPEDARF